jgi:hypothetical protein
MNAYLTSSLVRHLPRQGQWSIAQNMPSIGRGTSSDCQFNRYHTAKSEKALPPF